MARKSKGFGKISQPQRADKIQQKRLKKLHRKIQTGLFSDKFAGIAMNKGEVKMSEVLEAFVEPYLDLVPSMSQRQQLLDLAVIAWNLAFMPENELPSTLDYLLQDISKDDDPFFYKEIRSVINDLITRKKEVFAEHKRYIVACELQDAGKEFHLSVISTLLNPFVANLAD
ncbi:hypothetical protein [Laspinema palackyanum]|uniref:hypothetical protein n=1 Tax=Laspinema palackyanum TaxID=3231601 RepID=UPI00345CEF12|nr:hypothetical protein [Laspinema sp. D2c]